MSGLPQKKRRRTPQLAAVVLVWLAVVAVIFSGRDTVFSISLPDGTDYPVRAITFDAAERDDLWRLAGSRYREGDYEAAAELFEALEAGADLAARHEATLFRGISLLMDGRPAEARAALEKARHLADEVGVLGDAGEFYLGLAALAEDDLDTAMRLFEETRGGPFEQDTRVLLAALDAGHR